MVLIFENLAPLAAVESLLSFDCGVPHPQDTAAGILLSGETK